jgi:hypothetical protein
MKYKGKPFICMCSMCCGPCSLVDIIRACGACDSGSNPDRGVNQLISIPSVFFFFCFHFQ